MATITISGNWRVGGPDNEFAGSGTVRDGRIECSASLYGTDAYELIEDQIEDGATSGSVTVVVDEDGREVTYHWEMAD